MTIGERIRNLREANGWSQSQLAKRAGYCNKSAISKIESAGDNITNKTVNRLAPVLGTTPAYLLGMSGESVAHEPIMFSFPADDEFEHEAKKEQDQKHKITSPKLRKYVQDANYMYEVEEKVQQLVDMAKENGIKEIRGTVTTKPIINTEPEETLLLALYRLLNKDNKQSLSNIIQNMIAKQSGEEGSTT